MLALAKLKASKELSEALIWERRSSLFLFQTNLYPIFTREEVENCFSSVRRPLTEEGRLLIELLIPSVKMLAREADRRYPVGQYDDPKAGSQVFVTEEVHFDATSQINPIQWFFRNEGSDKETVLSLEMRQFFPPEFDALLWYKSSTSTVATTKQNFPVMPGSNSSYAVLNRVSLLRDRCFLLIRLQHVVQQVYRALGHSIIKPLLNPRVLPKRA